MVDVYPLTSENRRSIADHAQRYLASDGADGYLVGGVEHLILTTIGRRSGESRSTPLIFARDADRYLIVGSLGGYDKPPHWYLNLLANPTVTIQVRDERFLALSRTATSAERARLWPLVCEVFPIYEEHQARTEREIPVVILERLGVQSRP